jgi:hypothetical protein
MSPEQVAGDQSVGPASDLYSLGVILYEMLTGQLPFQGSMAAVLAQILTQEPRPPSALRPDLDPALEAICLKALAKKPTERHPSMGELAAELTAYLSGEVTVSRPAKGAAPPTASPAVPGLAAQPETKSADPVEPARQERPRRWWRRLVGACLVLVAAGAVYLGVTANRPGVGDLENGRDPGVPELAPADPDVKPDADQGEDEPEEWGKAGRGHGKGKGKAKPKAKSKSKHKARAGRQERPAGALSRR